ncbi:MAG: hypothetical protein U9Q82_02740, partial [Chloroflexota bacterium]|nr:hypothetical protein [Chloroflexota bacterium]
SMPQALKSSLAILNALTKGNTAYLDPGSGSFILQLLIAGLVGAGFLLRGYWGKLTSFFRGSSAQEKDNDDASDVG